MNGQKIGYIRVSSHGQCDERQLDGVKLDKVFREKVSAKTKDRPGLQECLDYLRSGDELHCHSIDRLARNLGDLLSIVEGLLDKGVIIRFHKENLTFSGNTDPMSQLMLQMMGAFAEFERSLILERQREGVAKAIKRGVRFGQAPKLSQEQRAEVLKMADLRYSKTAIAQEFGVSRQTIYNVLRA